MPPGFVRAKGAWAAGLPLATAILGIGIWIYTTVPPPASPIRIDSATARITERGTWQVEVAFEILVACETRLMERMFVGQGRQWRQRPLNVARIATDGDVATDQDGRIFRGVPHPGSYTARTEYEITRQDKGDFTLVMYPYGCTNGYSTVSTVLSIPFDWTGAGGQ